MTSEQSLDHLRGLEWLVEARNQSQTLMFRLLQNWDKPHISPNRRDLVAAAFSLWRAAFLLVKKEQEKTRQRVDDAAEVFLKKVIRTNAITFNDDLESRLWTSVYYVENALFRIKVLTGDELMPFDGSPSSTVRQAWNEAFERLDAFVTGTLSGTTTENPTPPTTDQSA